MKTQAELIAYYERNLEKVKAHHTGWQGEDYVKYAQDQLDAVKQGGMDALLAFWKQHRESQNI